MTLRLGVSQEGVLCSRRREYSCLRPQTFICIMWLAFSLWIPLMSFTSGKRHFAMNIPNFLLNLKFTSF